MDRKLVNLIVLINYFDNIFSEKWLKTYRPRNMTSLESHKEALSMIGRREPQKHYFTFTIYSAKGSVS